jgi:hypothetical protein
VEGGFVFRRPLTSLVALVLAAALAPAALAVGVKVRVEGRTTTIFGATEPLLQANATALDALEAASVAGEFFYNVRQTSFGPFVDHVGRYPAAGASGWVFKVNGVSPPVGAAAFTLKQRDVVLWYWADFSSGEGPRTLRLTRLPGSCYSVVAQDGNGSATPAARAVLRFDGRTRRTSQAGRACIGKHRGLVRATLPGTVRSNAVA